MAGISEQQFDNSAFRRSVDFLRALIFVFRRTYFYIGSIHIISIYCVSLGIIELASSAFALGTSKWALT